MSTIYDRAGPIPQIDEKAPTQIKSELDHLRNAARQLEELCSGFVARIHSILAPEVETGKSAGPMSAIEKSLTEPLAPLASELRVTATDLVRLRSMLATVLDRIQLP